MSALSALFERFLRERRYLQNVTPKTLTWYQTAFDAFTRAVEADDPQRLSKSLLQDFVVRLRERGLSPVSCNTYLKAINESLTACMPLKFTGGLGGALAGRPIAIRYVDNRDLGRQAGKP